MRVSVDTSFLECGNDSLWLLSEKAAKQNTFLIVGGVLAAMLCIYVLIIITEQSSFKKLLRMGSVRRRELWLNVSFSVALVALNLLLLGGIQKKFKETFAVIMSVFGAFSLLCSIAGIYFVSSRLGRAGSSIVNKATEFMTGNADTANMQTIIATDRYQDFGNDIFGTLWLGVAQVILLSMYVFAVYADLSEEATGATGSRMLSNETEATNEFEQEYSAPIQKNIYAPFYALALFVQIGYVFGKDTVKDRFRHYLFWGKAFRACRDKKAYDWKTRGASTINPVELIVRVTLSILVNDVGLLLLLLVLPLQLSAVNRKDCFDFSDKISDFVLNAVAIYYVVEVDDMGGENEYTLAEEKEGVSTTPRTTRANTEDEGEEANGRSGGSFFFEEYDIEEGDEHLSKRESGRSVPV